MKLKISSANLEYSLKYSISQMLTDLVSLILIIVFAYNLHLGKISLSNVLNMCIILLVIFTFRLFKKFTVYLLVYYIEKSNNDNKLRIFLFTHRIWLISNPLLYFMSSNIEFDIKIRRMLTSKPNAAKLFYKLILFLFYYPLTRLLYFHRRLVDKLMLDHEHNVVFSRMESYVLL